MTIQPHEAFADLPLGSALLAERRKRLTAKRLKLENGLKISKEEQDRIDELSAALGCTEGTCPNMWKILELDKPL